MTCVCKQAVQICCTERARHNITCTNTVQSQENLDSVKNSLNDSFQEYATRLTACRLNKSMRLAYGGHLMLGNAISKPALIDHGYQCTEDSHHCCYCHILYDIGRYFTVQCIDIVRLEAHLNSRCTLVDMTQLTWKGLTGLLMSDACSTALISSTRSSSFSSRNGPGRQG